MARETKKQTLEYADPILVDMNGLQNLCGAGRHTCEKIAAACDAKIKIGKRALYNADKIRKYINSMGEV